MVFFPHEISALFIRGECVCVCVCERERNILRGQIWQGWLNYYYYYFYAR